MLNFWRALMTLLAASDEPFPLPDMFDTAVAHLPPASSAAQPTATAASWLVTMPGTHRPFVLADKDSEADARIALGTIARNFADTGWALDWESETICHVRKSCSEGDLVSRLEVQPREL